MSIEIRKFRKNNDGLELITAADSSIILGRLVWDPVIGKPSFTKKGMPSHLVQALTTGDVISKEQMVAFENELRNVELGPAEIADKVIDVDISTVSAFEHPKLGELNKSFELESIKKFTFENLQARSMTSLQRVQIDEWLDELKETNWKEYKRAMRRAFMITTLYYGSAKIVVDRQLSAQVEAGIAAANLKVLSKLEASRSVEYTFDHDALPFAMRLEKVREFVG